MRTKLFLFLLLTFQISFAGHRDGCECEWIEVEDQVKASNVVFSGRVIDISTNWISGGSKITFAVDSSWVRKIPKYFTVNTGSESECGYLFQKSQPYLVYVVKEFSYKTNQCVRTQKLVEADKDLKVLGAGIAPGPVPGTDRFFIIMTVGVVLSMLFVLFVVLRKRIFKRGRSGKPSDQASD